MANNLQNRINDLYCRGVRSGARVSQQVREDPPSLFSNDSGYGGGASAQTTADLLLQATRLEDRARQHEADLNSFERSLRPEDPPFAALEERSSPSIRRTNLQDQRRRLQTNRRKEREELAAKHEAELLETKEKNRIVLERVRKMRANWSRRREAWRGDPVSTEVSPQDLTPTQIRAQQLLQRLSTKHAESQKAGSATEETLPADASFSSQSASSFGPRGSIEIGRNESPFSGQGFGGVERLPVTNALSVVTPQSSFENLLGQIDSTGERAGSQSLSLIDFYGPLEIEFFTGSGASEHSTGWTRVPGELDNLLPKRLSFSSTANIPRQSFGSTSPSAGSSGDDQSFRAFFSPDGEDLFDPGELIELARVPAKDFEFEFNRSFPEFASHSLGVVKASPALSTPQRLSLTPEKGTESKVLEFNSPAVQEDLMREFVHASPALTAQIPDKGSRDRVVVTFRGLLSFAASPNLAKKKKTGRSRDSPVFNVPGLFHIATFPVSSERGKLARGNRFKLE